MADAVTTAAFEVHDPTHGALPAAALVPGGEGPWPLCVFLYGGGGKARNLFELAPLLEAGFADGTIPPMLVACLGVDPWCFYLDDPPRGLAWETAVAEHLPAEVRRRLPASDRAGLVGISMGGFGALAIAFARPERFTAVAAVAPMIEPSLEADRTPARNRFHYPAECPPALVGEVRDPVLFRRSHPAHRAREHVERIAAADLAVWIDAGSRDSLHAHDGAELLHRVLWDLDLPHAYHLHRDADHVGPTVVPRLRDAFAWVGRRLATATSLELSSEEAALRTALEPARARALAVDPTVARVYGVLPGLRGRARGQ